MQCKSESAQCSENSRVLVRGRGRGLKYEKLNAGKTIKSTPKKTLVSDSPDHFLKFLFHPDILSIVPLG